jgi:hypothetical protein
LIWTAEKGGFRSDFWSFRAVDPSAIVGLRRAQAAIPCETVTQGLWYQVFLQSRFARIDSFLHAS